MGILGLATVVAAVEPPSASASSAIRLQRPSSPKWAAVSIPEPAGSFDGKLIGATCASPTDCLAVGWGAATGALLGTLVEQWNGKAWEPQTSPNPTAAGDTFPQLNAVSCATTQHCTAVGTDFTLSNTSNSMVESWNGKAWAVVSSPDVAGAITNTLSGVACVTSTFCMAVGDSEPASPDLVTLAEQWNGSSYAVGDVGLGSAGESGNTQTYAEVWNGKTWTAMSSPQPAGATYARLTGIACAGVLTCVATGYTEATPGAAPVAFL
ncbi:MAG: hypothetical protein ABSE47_11875, partial [Acidimicrobiales bacterium]